MAVAVALPLLLLPIAVAAPASSAGTAFPLDPTFAAAEPVPGLLQLQLAGLGAQASLVRQMADDSVIVVLSGVSSQGFLDNRQAIAKLRPNGTLDASFNPGGPVPGILDVQLSHIVDIDIDSHGRIIVASTDMVTRVLGNGSLDSTFVATCITPCVPGTGTDPPRAPPGSVYVTSRVYDLTVLADDSIVIESSTEINVPLSVIQILKLTPTGDRDLTFNPANATPGVLLINDYGPAHLLPQADGSFLVVPLSTPSRLRHITADGQFDLSYGGGTGVVFPPGAKPGEATYAAYTDGADRIVLLVGGTVSPVALSMIRIGPDGRSDTTFGTGGRVELADLGAGSTGPLLVQPDHRIIIQVFADSQPGALARLTADGRLDASFNSGSATPGWLVVDPSPDASHTHPIVDLIQATGGMLLAAGVRQPHPPIATGDVLAEIYRFNGFPGAAQPIPLYPISSPPLIAEPAKLISGAATATKPAKRLGVP